MVTDGTKRQTIRSRRKHAPRVGQRAALYYAMRTKWCRKIKDETITKVVTLIIATNAKTDQPEIILFDRRLENLEFQLRDGNIHLLTKAQATVLRGVGADSLAWSDGFRPDGSSLANPAGSWELMRRWWAQTHELPFIGDVIFW